MRRQKLGTYVIITQVKGQEVQQVIFDVIAGPNLAALSSWASSKRSLTCAVIFACRGEATLTVS